MATNLTASEWAGWIGAVTGGLALTWDFYKWKKSGPKIVLDVQSEMRLVALVSNVEHIVIRATNKGDQSTTLTNLAFAYYKNFLRYLFNKPTQNYVVPLPITALRIPCELKPGTIWDGAIIQNKDIEKLRKTGKIVIHLYCSHSNKPIRQLVRFRETNV